METIPQRDKPKRGRYIRIGVPVIVIAAIILAFGQYTGWFQSYHEITTGRGTFITKATSRGQTTTTTVVLPSESIKGKFPTNQQMYISFPWAKGPYITATVTRIEIATPGFTVQQVTPILPISAPNEGSIEIKIYIKTPSQVYVGPLDYTVYIDATT